MKAILAATGFMVLAAGCARVEAPKPVDVAQAPFSTLHLVTRLSGDDNVKLREGLMTLAEAAAADAPPMMLVMSEMNSPAFNFHVQGECAVTTPYIEDLIMRSAAAAALRMPKPDIACVEVNPGGLRI